MNGSDIYNALQPYTGDRPERIEVNKKFMHPRKVDNLSAWAVLTNEAVPMAVANEDRRWAVAAGRERVREPAFYATASDWLKLPETGHLIRAYLKLRWEEDMCVERRAALRGHAPRTEAKTAMINAGLNPTIGYVRAVIDGTYGVAQWPDLMCPGDIVAQLNTARESGDIPRNAPTPGAHSAGAWMAPLHASGKKMNPVRSRNSVTLLPDMVIADGSWSNGRPTLLPRPQ
jgi:hypothetical protein